MTEADINRLLSPLADGKVYPYIVRLNEAGKPAIDPPWIVFSIVSQQFADVFCGTAESESSLQVDVYAVEMKAARALREQVVAALKPLNPIEHQYMQMYDSTAGLFRAILDVKIID